MSPVSTSLRPGRGSPRTSAGRHGAARVDRHLLPGLQPSARRAVRDAQRIRRRNVEPPGPLGLGDQVPEGLGAVLDGESLDRVVAPLERLPRLELDERERIREPPEERLQPLEQLAQARAARRR